MIRRTIHDSYGDTIQESTICRKRRLQSNFKVLLIQIKFQSARQSCHGYIGYTLSRVCVFSNAINPESS